MIVTRTIWCQARLSTSHSQQLREYRVYIIAYIFSNEPEETTNRISPKRSEISRCLHNRNCQWHEWQIEKMNDFSFYMNQLADIYLFMYLYIHWTEHIWLWQHFQAYYTISDIIYYWWVHTNYFILMNHLYLFIFGI